MARIWNVTLIGEVIYFESYFSGVVIYEKSQREVIE